MSGAKIDDFVKGNNKENGSIQNPKASAKPGIGLIPKNWKNSHASDISEDDSESTVDSIQHLLANDRDFASLLGHSPIYRSDSDSSDDGKLLRKTKPKPVVNKEQEDDSLDEDTYQISELIKEFEERKRKRNESDTASSSMQKIEDDPEFKARLKQAEVVMLGKMMSKLQSLQLELRSTKRGIEILEKRLEREDDGDAKLDLSHLDDSTFVGESDSEDGEEAHGANGKERRKSKRPKSRIGKLLLKNQMPRQKKMKRKPYKRWQIILLWVGVIFIIVVGIVALETWLFFGPEFSAKPIPYPSGPIPWGENIPHHVKWISSKMFDSTLLFVFKMIWRILKYLSFITYAIGTGFLSTSKYLASKTWSSLSSSWKNNTNFSRTDNLSVSEGTISSDPLLSSLDSLFSLPKSPRDSSPSSVPPPPPPPPPKETIDAFIKEFLDESYRVVVHEHAPPSTPPPTGYENYEKENEAEGEDNDSSTGMLDDEVFEVPTITTTTTVTSTTTTAADDTHETRHASWWRQGDDDEFIGRTVITF